jgi:LacI family transcriptional regulator
MTADRTNLADVAREAGVHTSTASRALNPATRSVVSARTVERVQAAAERLGYRPNSLARGLRTARTFTVGIIVPDLENPLFPPLVRGAEQALGNEGYSLLIGNTDNDRQHTEAVIAALIDRRVDGLILATAELTGSLEVQVRTSGTPIVLVNRQSVDASIPAVIGDDHVGMGLAVDHLVALGHHRIGHVSGPMQLSTGAGRAQAFRDHMAKHGLAANGCVEVANGFQIEPGNVAAKILLRRNPDMTALVAANDLLALGAIQAITTAGFRVPDSVSVTGYNDMPFVDMVQPPLTTVRVPYRRMGEMAAGVLLDILLHPGEPRQSIHLTPTLTVRASTAPPSA